MVCWWGYCGPYRVQDAVVFAVLLGAVFYCGGEAAVFFAVLVEALCFMLIGEEGLSPLLY